MEPWGTPEWIVFWEEDCPLNVVKALRPLRYEASHLVMAGGRDDRRRISIIERWSTESKALVRSMATMTVR